MNKYKVGDHMIVTGNSNGHEFYFLQHIKIIAIPEDDESGYECESVLPLSENVWYVLEDEMIPYINSFNKTYNDKEVFAADLKARIEALIAFGRSQQFSKEDVFKIIDDTLNAVIPTEQQIQEKLSSPKNV